MAHIARSLRLLGRGAPAAQAAAQDVMDLETALASASRKLEELNDPIRNYHRMSPAEVTARYTPTVQWSERLAAWSIHPEFVVVGQPEFYVRVELLLHRTPVPVLRDYLRMRLLDTYADDAEPAVRGRELPVLWPGAVGQEGATAALEARAAGRG